MSYPVKYYCPHCGTIVELEREGYLADKAVTPYPLEGWEYAPPEEAFEDADGVVFTCGEDGLAVDTEWTIDADDAQRTIDADDSTGGDAGPVDEEDRGCGRQFYLSFVRYEDGEEIDPRQPSRQVRIAGEGPRSPRGPPGPGIDRR